MKIKKQLKNKEYVYQKPCDLSKWLHTYVEVNPQNILKCKLKSYKYLSDWYIKISNREAVIKGFDFMKNGAKIPQP